MTSVGALEVIFAVLGDGEWLFAVSGLFLLLVGAFSLRRKYRNLASGTEVD
jgi:uncharacterized membrane protein